MGTWLEFLQRQEMALHPTGASEGCETPDVGAGRHCFQRLGVSLLHDTDDIELNIY